MNNMLISCFLSILCLPTFSSKSEDKPALTVKSWPSSGALKFIKGNENNEYFYSYTYTDNTVVYLTCEAMDSVENPLMFWAVGIPINNSVTSQKDINYSKCIPKNVTGLNYITKLTKFHNGNNLTCNLQNSKGFYTAQLKLSCLGCVSVQQHKFGASCQKSIPIRMYVDGDHIKDNMEVPMDTKVKFHCEINDTSQYKVDFGNKETLQRLSGSKVSYVTPSVASLDLTMSEKLNGTELFCQGIPKRDNITTISSPTVHLYLLSRLFITVNRTDSVWNSSRPYQELEFHDNEVVNFKCQYNKPKDGPEPRPAITLSWERNGKNIVKGDLNKDIIYSITLKRENDNDSLTCKDDVMVTKRTIVFKYKQESTTLATEDESETTSNTVVNVTSKFDLLTIKPVPFADHVCIDIRGVVIEACGTPEPQVDPSYVWIAAVALALLLTIAACIAYKYKKRQQAKPIPSDISYTNFQNDNIYSPGPAAPTLDPLYSGPLDDVNIYSYTTPEQLPPDVVPQETYSTPFVPTVEEMYTQPQPKKLRIGKPTYPLPETNRKNQYANVSNTHTSLRNQPDPGYSSVATDDNASETYTYCSVPGYSRVN